MFRKFSIWIVKNLLVILLVTFIFSTVALDIPNMIKGLFGDIFSYASHDAQKEIVSKLTTACSSLDEKGISGLKQMPNSMPIDLSRMGGLCKDYNAGKINDKEFFFDVIGSAIPDEFDLPKVSALEKYNSIIETLNRNKIIYLIVLVILFVLLYLLIMNFKLFIMALTGISFSVGILILLPYVAILVYGRLAGFDTTPILLSILQGSFSLDINAIISVVLLMILRTYTLLIIALGIAFLGIGIAGKVYIWKSRKEIKTTETKTKKKSEKDKKETKKDKPDKKQTKEEEEEAYKHRNRTTKEILDELEDIHKKKTQKKNTE